MKICRTFNLSQQSAHCVDFLLVLSFAQLMTQQFTSDFSVQHDTMRIIYSRKRFC